ncbi:MAG: calcium:proton antiporter, partial [Agrobacterium tumefaciens]
MVSRIRQERLLLIPIIAAVLALFLEHSLLAAGQIASLLGAAALIAAIVVGSMRVAHHAEILAHKVGDPYGTMI